MRAFLFAIALAAHATAQQPSRKATLGGAPHVSPDGSRILFTSNRSGKSQVYSTRADGSDVRQLTTDDAGAHSAKWSPDGKRIVYVTEGTVGQQIVVIDADGGHRTPISDAKGNQTPSWSPDGTKIVFAAGVYPRIDIHTMNADGSDRRPVPPEGGFSYDPVWSPDGKLMAYVSGVPGQGPRVHLMNADGTNRRRLTTLDGGEERPSWSPDGKQLAFQSSTRANGVSDANIVVVDVSTGAARRVTSHRRPMLDETPSWFPDGQRLAIQSDRDGTWSVYVIDSNGATKDRLTSPVNYYNPRWSPDGKTIVFESTRDGKYAVYTVAPDGSRLTKLTGDTYDSEQPNWSPDGRRIVYSSNRDGGNELYLMNPDGSGHVRLTRTPPGGGKYGARFSPNGKWILFQGRSNNALLNENLYVVGTDGSGLRRLTDTTRNSVGGAWVSDGLIRFTQTRYDVMLWSEMTPEEMQRGKKNEQTVTVRLDGSEVSRVAKTVAPERDGDVSPDGRLVVYDKNEGMTWGIYVRDVATAVERVVVGGLAQPARR